MRSRYRVLEPQAPHFITATIVEWLPVFASPPCCDILLRTLEYCREHRALKIHGWVIMENHFHAVLSGPDLSQTIASFKKFTAQAILAQLREEGREWLLHQFAHYRAIYKKETQRHQVWQEGTHPQAILNDEIMRQKLEYIHNNPVKRGWVASPEHWRYSSAHEWLSGTSPLLRCDP